MVTPNTTPYKPSPLSFGSPRSSPFRRPSVASSPPAAFRQNAPSSPGSKGPTPSQSPSKLNQPYHTEDDVFTNPSEPVPTARFREPQSSPTRGANVQGNRFSMIGNSSGRERPTSSGEALSKLPPTQLRELRESFQVLDRDNDGQVNREDVSEVLRNLGQNSSPSTTATYFPSGEPNTINLPTYLNKIATLLAPLSSSQELLDAFSAFDEDDSGQINIAELKDALLHTSPEGEESQLTEQEIDEVVYGFTGKRAFERKTAKSSNLAGSRGRSDVFRYQEFVGNLSGGSKSQKMDSTSQEA